MHKPLGGSEPLLSPKRRGVPCPCHLENRRKYPCAGRSAQLVLSVLLLIVALSLTKDAVARIDTSSNSLSFGSVTVGTSLNLGVTLTNDGSRSVTVSQATVTGAGFSISGLVLPLTLKAGQNATFNVEFAPAVGGSVTGALSIITNVRWNSSINISLSGTGVAQPTANLSAPSMTFASQALGTTSSAQAVTLTNSGGTTLNITSIALTGANASDFAQTNNCGASVTTGTNCTITVTFTPAACGTRTAAVTLTDNAAGSPQTVSLSGTGAAALASLSPTSLAFGNQSVGATSAAQTVTLSNTGNAALSITSLTLTGTNAGDFAQTNTCGSSVAASANCTISVTFKPAASGSRTASVSVTDNASGSPQTVSLSGTGTGTAAVASLSPTSLAFGNQSVGATSAAQTVTLSNTGNAALSITSLALTGTNPSDFAQTNTCGSSVAAGNSCTISVTFKPTASGSRTASVSITDNASGSPQTVSLSGTGTGTAAVASLSPTSLAFGNQSVGATSAAQTVTLSNTGTAALSITSLALTGTNAGDFTQTNTCGSSVAAGGNCTIRVTFKPTASGSRTASVSITDNASGSPQTVSLSGTGTGTAAVASLSPTSLAFGNQSVGVTSGAQTLTLSNTGTAALSITSLALTGTNASDFAQSNTCGTSVAAGANCTIAVMFTPSIAGTEAASLSIADNASGSPQTVSLSGAGTHDVILSWAASTTSGVSWVQCFPRRYLGRGEHDAIEFHAY